MQDEQLKLDVYEYIKYFVSVNGLVKILMNYNPLLEKNDIIHSVWVDFFERNYDKKYSDTDGRSLKSYVYQSYKWYMIKAIKKEIINNVISNINIDYYGDKTKSQEEKLIAKETDIMLAKAGYGNENKKYVEGTSQASIGRKKGVSRQAVHQHIKIQRKRPEKLLNKYL